MRLHRLLVRLLRRLRHDPSRLDGELARLMGSGRMPSDNLERTAADLIKLGSAGIGTANLLTDLVRSPDDVLTFTYPIGPAESYVSPVIDAIANREPIIAVTLQRYPAEVGDAVTVERITYPYVHPRDASEFDSAADPDAGPDCD